jgi:hypothetical protein
MKARANLMAGSGQSRHFGDARITSALPLIPTFIGWVAARSNCRPRQNRGTKKLQAHAIDLLARKVSTQQFKHCHGKFA